MKRFFYVNLVIALFIGELSAQQTGTNRSAWLSSTLSIGSENNIGYSGLFFKNSFFKEIAKNVATGPSVSFFHAIPSWSIEPGAQERSFSAFNFGIDILHNQKFGNDKKYVLMGVGAGVINSIILRQGPGVEVFDMNGRYVTTYSPHIKETFTEMSLHVFLEGGGRVSDRVSLGLVIDVYSYHIFGDITVLGINTKVKL